MSFVPTMQSGLAAHGVGPSIGTAVETHVRREAGIADRCQARGTGRVVPGRGARILLADRCAVIVARGQRVVVLALLPRGAQSGKSKGTTTLGVSGEAIPSGTKGDPEHQG